MKITVAQLNPVVGDIAGNLAKIFTVLSKSGKKSDLVIFSELFLTGYYPGDLLKEPGFIEKTQAAVAEIVKISGKYPDTGILLGLPMPTGRNTGKRLYNSAVLISGGEILTVCHKSLLSADDISDETRYFDPAPDVEVIMFKGHTLGISIGEDMWNAPELWPGRPYTFAPVEKQAAAGASLFINLSASSFCAGEEEDRYRIIQDHARKHGVPFLFVNQVGANDELIFDGRSTCVDRSGEPISVFPAFKEHVETIETDDAGTPGLYSPQDETASVYDALVIGVRDYMNKCGFSKAVVGLSGGIDSAVTCTLAAMAVGSRNVLGVSIPSPYSSKKSVEYARTLAQNLGIRFKEVPITEIYHAYIQVLEKDLPVKKEKGVDVWLQNIQARIRGNILMAFSNKQGMLVLATGNKSESAVGYCTLYGDMTGGLAVISDVFKKMVYRLADYINKDSEIIPRAIIDRPPSAELKPGQLDQDTLPPYDVLDEILHYYLEEKYSAKKLQEKGFDAKTVKWVIEAVKKNGYKRRQAPPGLKVTSRTFRTGRKMPIAAKWD